MRTRESHRQSDEHWNCFKGNVSKDTSQRRGGAHMSFSERTDTILNWIELKYKNNNNNKTTTTKNCIYKRSLFQLNYPGCLITTNNNYTTRKTMGHANIWQSESGMYTHFSTAPSHHMPLYRLLGGCHRHLGLMTQRWRARIILQLWLPSPTQTNNG